MSKERFLNRNLHLIIDDVKQRVTHKINLVAMSPVKLLFKRKDHEHPADIIPDRFYPGTFPGPQLRGDVIKDPDPVPVGEPGHAKVESRVIDQDQHIRLECQQVLFAETKVSHDCPEMDQHLPKTHKGQVAVMLDQASPGMLHQVATPAPELCVMVF